MWASNWYLGNQTIVEGAILVTELGIELMQIDAEVQNPIDIEIQEPIEVTINADIEVEICG